MSKRINVGLAFAMSAILSAEFEMNRNVRKLYLGHRSKEPIPPEEESFKVMFTEEEKEKLATLSGKDKKKYVRELKQKHGES